MTISRRSLIAATALTTLAAPRGWSQAPQTRAPTGGADAHRVAEAVRGTVVADLMEMTAAKLLPATAILHYLRGPADTALSLSCCCQARTPSVTRS